MKNEKSIKKVVIGFFVGIGAAILFVFRTILQGQRDAANATRDGIAELKRAAEQQQRNNREAVSGIDGALNTIAEIRKNQKYVEDDSVLDQWYCSELFSDNSDNDLGCEPLN